MLSMPVLDSGPALAAALDALGYRQKGLSGTRMCRALGLPIDEPILPTGMKLGDCVEVDLAERAEAHRDAWGHLEHIGIPDARSSFSVERYERLRATPGYEPRLDLVVTTEAGPIAACCICWVDERNGIGLFEPVGTRFQYRRQGLARALVLEGLRRLRRRGLHSAIIGTASFNHPAEAAYLSCGFEIVDRETAYLKELTPG